MNKKGAATDFLKSPVFWTVAVVIVFTISVFLFPFLSSLFSDTISTEKAKGISGFNDVLTDSAIPESILTISGFIFGQIPNALLDQTTSAIGAVIIAIAVWFLIFFTFGDIIATFSTFNKSISWAIAFLLAVISANLQLTTNITLLASSIFVSLGLVGLFLGLGSAFVAFVLVNFGVQSAKPWLIQRRALMEAATGKAGAVKAAGGLEVLADIEEKAEEIGK